MTVRERTARNRVWRWARLAVQAAVLVSLAIDTAKLRQRVAGLRVLAEAPPPTGDRSRVLQASEARVDPATLGAARAYAQAEGLAALDLVPADLPVAQALALLREVDPVTYRADRLASGRGACHAVLADDRLLEAAGITTNRRKPTPIELAGALAQLKLHAPASTDLVVAPRLRSDLRVAARSPETLATLHGTRVRRVIAPHLLMLSASALLGRGWGAAALGAWSAQPLLVFAGSRGLRPADLWSYSATRIINEPRRLRAALRAARQLALAEADPVELRRPAYQADLAEGTGRLFEPEASCCPWCGGTDLRVRLRTTDLLQHKPGEFRLDQCQACEHIFQNPRLSPDGLEFYYRDFYDGLGEQLMAWLGSRGATTYRSRAEALRPFGEPKSWLDVGTGHGYFCNVAGEVWPQARFDGLDISEGVKLAEHRGWVERGYQGSFVDLAPDMAGAYDVVSMFHYLEHTTEPQRELEAARTALRPGGHLLIEVPDPESPWPGLLGKWWVAWLQPQHLHFIPVANLRQRLEELDFAVVLEQHAEANRGVDLTAAIWFALNAVAPRDDLPWLPHPPTRLRRLARARMMAAGRPLLYGAVLVDRAIGSRRRLSNAYRILARKN